MTKIFEPKITQGRWIVSWPENSMEDPWICLGGHKEVRMHLWDEGNIRAIVALPDLLDVYKAGKSVADNHTSPTMRKSMHELKEAIRRLEERHV